GFFTVIAILAWLPGILSSTAGSKITSVIDHEKDSVIDQVMDSEISQNLVTMASIRVDMGTFFAPIMTMILYTKSTIVMHDIPWKIEKPKFHHQFSNNCSSEVGEIHCVTEMVTESHMLVSLTNTTTAATRHKRNIISDGIGEIFHFCCSLVTTHD